ncbi:sugar-binding protein [Paenibacillus riograndensis]|uniref:Carbohydrate-binding family 9 n=2 Tax=Paenibacillus riograndensis TaxID=483937 RepID=A0A0E4HE13_9BACL|nr:sugar-binding protein [Paenibacillus riograndensis]CQR57727.1 carbohydrate-binding family 9 [Paenibacillus riograndensis SBR5]
MSHSFKRLSTVLLAILLLPWFPVYAGAAEPSPMFEDSFTGGLDNWDLFGSNAWSIGGAGTEAQLEGTTSLTSPQRAVVKASKLPYSSTDYNMEFTAQGDRFRVIFRYFSGTAYYFLEFKSTKSVEMWKYPNSSTTVQVGTPADIGAAIPGFSLSSWHQYRLEVKGSAFSLYVDGTLVTTFTDATLSAGGAGFSLKSLSASSNANLKVKQVRVSPIEDQAEFSIVHTPAGEIPYNSDLPLSFSVKGGDSVLDASIHYAYGEAAPDQIIQAAGSGTGPYSGTIAGTNQFSKIRYYLTAQNDEGRTVRYPESGEITVPIGGIVPYINDFEGETLNVAPVGWNVGGNTKVIQLPDGNKVFNLNGSGSARLNLPMYLNADNFTVKFKVRYERTSEAVQNTWRFRYRSVDDGNNNALEWATHNSKYFLMRKTTLGGNYYLANYVKSLLDEWHDYELRVSGITHKLFIDGVEVASGDDSDPLALKKGYFQWNVVGGINLMIDDFAIEPIPVPPVIDLQPSGNYAGIYSLEESPGFKLALEAGAEAHNFQIDYTVRRADGDQAVVASGTKTYQMEKYAKNTDTVLFDPRLNTIGTYEVAADFRIDGVAQPAKSKKMRLTVINAAAPVSQPDLDNESKFGLNTHYALNWNDDIIDGARKMGARHHRSGITWDSVDKNVKDASGNTVYDYSGTDPLLTKLFSYGFNQVTVLGIDKNAFYQQGTINTTSGLKAMGDFVANTVSRYKDQIRQWEMPNEPEIFSKPYVPSEFVQLQKVAYLNMKQADQNAMLLAGDHTSSVLSVLPKELELGSFDYADAYSYHPYVYNAMPDDNLQNIINGVKDLVNAYGGWKDYYLTEGGWPTATAGYPSVSEETQRDYIVRAFLNYMVTDQIKAYEYYNYKNDGTDDRYYDIFWGLTDNDGRPKLAYTAVNQLMTTLDKSRYIGTWDTGNPDIAIHVFLNDGVPVITAWKKVDHKDDPAVKLPVSTITLPFRSEGVSIKDINGTAVPVTPAGGGDLQLAVSGSPVYITGASTDFVYQSAVKLLQGKLQEASTKLGKVQTAGNAALIQADLTELSRIESLMETALTGGSQAAGVEQGIKDIYTLMAKIAGQIKSGSLEQAPAYVALETLYNMAESASVALSFALDGTDANSLDYAVSVQDVTAAFNAKKGDYSVMPVATSAVLRLNRYGRLADAAYTRGRYADSYAYNLLAREFASAAAAISDSEPAKFIGVMANAVPTQANAEAGYANSITLSLVNNTNIPQQVTVKLHLPDGWESSQNVQLLEAVTIPAGSSIDLPYSILVPENTLKGRYDISFEILYNGAVFDTKTVQLTVEDGLDVKLIPVKKTIEELDVLSVQLTGTSSFSKTGKVIVKGPDGVLLEPLTTDTFSGLQKGGSVRLDFLWTYHDRLPFNEYTLDMQIVETDKNKLIYHDPSLPLEFNLIQQAHGLTIDGDLSDWEDAFPFHLRSKSQHASGYRDPGNLEAAAYAKWNAEGMYVAVSVQDDIHKQSENPANMWKNDSVQVSLDPLNNRESPYGPDDTEWGFALANDGRRLINIFNSTQPNPNGDVSGLTPFEAVRDEAAHRTIYEFQLPASYIKDLKPELEGRIGLNIAVNDADLQNGRDDFVQWTQGTADSKNTSLYDSFIFIDYTPPEPSADSESPTWPGYAAVTASDVTTNSVTLNWTEAQDNTAVTGYRIIWGDSVSMSVHGSVTDAVYGTVTDSVYATATSAVITGLNADTPYTFIVYARDAAGNWSVNGLEVRMRTASMPSAAGVIWTPFQADAVASRQVAKFRPEEYGHHQT